MTRALVHGAGRMARMLLAQMPRFEGYQLAGLVSRTRPDDLSLNDWFDSLEDLEAKADLLIDFTLPGGSRIAAEWCARNGVALLSGTTGLPDEDIHALKTAALTVPVLWAPNLSHGVALISSLVAQAAAALGKDARIHITETHHKHKLDAPSGTALSLAASAVQGQGERLEKLSGPGQPECLAGEDHEHAPTFTSLREGEVIGEHTVSFVLPDEVIEISHKALDRAVFANGALKAGEWLVRQKPGYYSTSDWLGLD